MDRFETFSLALFQISRYWNQLAAEEMRKYDLKGAHAFYLVTILRYDGQLTASQLQRLCGRDKADISRSIARMIELGMLIRLSENPYRAKLQLTDYGRTAADSVRQKAHIIVERVGKDLTPEERQSFYNALGLITSNMEDLCSEIL